jgi:hypothetical protein
MLARIRKHGIAIDRDLADATAATLKVAQTSHLDTLPNSIISDEDAPNEPPLTLALQGIDLADFGRGNSFAVTYFGPASLATDKTVNEDFALAGVIDGRDEKLSFGIVADGVTTKTFWPARASRIAAFAGYEVVKRFAREGWLPQRGTADEVGPFLDALCQAVNRQFDEDRKRLRETGAVPTRWDAKLFERHSEKTDFWYQTTLLVAVIGRAGGWLVFCGDGGAVRFLADGKRIVDAKVALESGETLELTTSVGIGVSAQNFKRAFIRPAPAGNSLHIVLASDGVDRTLQRTQPAAGSNRYATLDLGSRAAAETAIQALAELPEADRDNMSVVHVCFPPDSPWPTEKVVPIVVPPKPIVARAAPVAPPVARPVASAAAPPAAQPAASKVPATDPPASKPPAWRVGTIAIVALFVGASAGLVAAATGPGGRLVSLLQSHLGLGARQTPKLIGPFRDAESGKSSIPASAATDIAGPQTRAPSPNEPAPSTPATAPQSGSTAAPTPAATTPPPNEAAAPADQPPAASQSGPAQPAPKKPAAPAATAAPAPVSPNAAPAQPKGDSSEAAPTPPAEPDRGGRDKTSTGPAGG